MAELTRYEREVTTLSLLHTEERRRFRKWNH